MFLWVFSLVKKIELHIYLMSHAFLQVQSMVSADFSSFACVNTHTPRHKRAFSTPFKF